MAKIGLTFPVSSLRFVDLQFNSAFAVSFHSTRSDAWVKFDSGVISLDQSQFFATNSNQWDCCILYRQQITSNGFFCVFAKLGKGRLSSYGERFWKKKAFFCSSLFRYHIKQIDSMLPCICSVIDYRRRQNVVRTSVTHSAIASYATLTSSVIYYWTDARQQGIYLLNIFW